MLRIKVTIQVEYVANTEINHKERINIGMAITATFAKKNSDRHSPTSNKTIRVVVKMKSEGEKYTSVSPLFFFLNENGANPSNLDT
jgi:hypothetical protein